MPDKNKQPLHNAVVPGALVAPMPHSTGDGGMHDWGTDTQQKQPTAKSKATPKKKKQNTGSITIHARDAKEAGEKLQKYLLMPLRSTLKKQRKTRYKVP